MLFAGLFLAYVAAGVVMDFLLTRYYLCISDRLVFKAGVYAGIITWISLIIINHIVVSQRFILIFAYGVGNMIGTWLGMTAKIRRQR